MNFAEIFTDVPSVLKGIDSLVTTFEAKGSGEAKKKAVLDVLGSAYDVASASGVPLVFTKQEILTFADSAVNTVVTLKNNLGTFEHKIIADVESGAETVAHDIAQVGKDVVQGAETIAHDVVHGVEQIVHPQQ